MKRLQQFIRRSAALALGGFLLSSTVVAGAAEGGTIRGSVLDERGDALDSASVLIAETRHEVRVAPDGSFEISGLAAGEYVLEAQAPGYFVATLESVRVRQGEVIEVEVRLSPLPVPLDEIVVSARFSLLRDQPVAGAALSREQIRQLPHFGDDLYRAVSVLPGTSENDFSSRFNVRGGFHDEILVRLDGLEIYEPFHLKDFQGVFTILDPETIGAVDLIPASFPAEYGDRMSAVLDLTTTRPAVRRTSLGISFSNAWVGTSGAFADDKGRWLVSARRGYLDVILNFVDDAKEEGEGEETPSPRYWDLLGKLDYDLRPDQSLSLKVLAADDTLDLSEHLPRETTEVETAYGNTVLGLSHLAILGSRTVVDTILSATRVDHSRRGLGLEPDRFFELDDEREFDVVALRQDWSADLADRHFLKWGVEARQFSADYVYFNSLEDNDAIDDPRFPPLSGVTLFEDRFSGEQYSLYAADRMRIGNRLTAEIGARYDRATLTEDDLFSPRINLVYELAHQSVVRAGWGYFYQTQRPYELQVGVW